MLNIVLTMLLAAVGLVDAVKSGDRSAALALLQQKVNVNTPESDGTTALHWAVQKDDVDLVDRLIKAGANVKAKNDYGSTPMAEADRKSTRLNSSHTVISYAVFCLKKKMNICVVLTI